MRNIIVTGGLGYIGSFVTQHLLKNSSDRLIVIDNLSTGIAETKQQNWAESFKSYTVENRVHHYVCDVANSIYLQKIFDFHHPIHAVVHLAAFSEAFESIQHPLKYYNNNLNSLIALLHTMEQKDCTQLVFCSSCTAGCSQVTPYAQTKSWGEEMIKKSCAASGLGCVILRFFNACGANENGCMGENHYPETHVIPLFLNVALSAKEHLARGKAIPPSLQIPLFGTDYDTADGTCIRDFVHVEDLARAHLLALRKLDVEAARERGKGYFACADLGSGKGTSVKELIHVVEEVTGIQLPIKELPRRPGDFPVLVANNADAQAVLSWSPQFGLWEGVETAWKYLLYTRKKKEAN